MKQPLFILHHNCIYSSRRIFVLYKWQGRLFTWLNVLNSFSRPFYLLEDVVIFSTKPTGFLTFVLILSTGLTGDCNVDISEQVIYPVNDLVLCRISRL